MLRTPLLSGMKTLLSVGWKGCACRHGSPPGGSTLMTSAPMSASSCPAHGPATKLPNSSTRMPCSGPRALEGVSELSLGSMMPMQYTT